MSKPLVSLCMIVKNEEDVIARCLESAKDAADEIIVIDTGSTDRTIEAARLAGAAVYSREWKQDFAAARNESIGLAAGKWILVLDADEALEEGHGAKLRQIVESMPEADGFFVQIVNYVGTEAKQVGSSVSSSLRLFLNKPGYRYEGRIHEQIVQPILNANPAAKLHYSAIQLNHGGYLPEVVLKKNKVQRNMELLQQELQHTDNESFHRYNLGIEYMRTGDHVKALEQFRLSRTIADWRITSFGHVVVLREINCLQALGQWEAAAELGESAAEALNDYPDLFLTLGRIYYHLHRWEEADSAFSKALEIGPSPQKYTSASGSGTYTASFYLGKTREQLLDYEGAAICYANSLAFNPSLLSPFLRLVSLLTRTEDSDRITPRIEKLFRQQSPNTWWSMALSYYQLGLYRQAADILVNKTLPGEKRKDQAQLLLRCQLLSPDIGGKRPARTNGKNRRLAARKQLYEALARNDGAAAAECLARLEKEYAKLSPDSSPSPSAPADGLLLHVLGCLVRGKQPDSIPLTLPSPAYAVLWSELYFLYTLAVRRHLFGLQSQVLGIWKHLLNRHPDPVERLKGRYELVKTVHVRIYHLFGRDAEQEEFAALWNDVKPRLLTLIDDLLMEEVT